MDHAEWTPTGRRISGPSADLVEVVLPGGGIGTALEFHPAWHGDPTLVAATRLGGSFLEMPMVVGLVDLIAADPDVGRCIYRTGAVRSVAELLHHARVEGKKVSRLACLQLVALAAEILEEGAETGAGQGVFSHGDLNPWRLTVRASGEVQIIGYGVPCPDARASVLDRSRPPRVDAIRYAPPERLLGAPEDASSDVYSLVLVVVELMRGAPLIDGTADEVREAITGGHAARMLSKLASELGAPVVKVLAPALAFDPAARYESGFALSAAVTELLAGVRGGADLAAAVVPVFAASEGRLLDVPGSRAPAARPVAPVAAPATAAPVAAPVAEGRWSAPSRSAVDPAPAPADPKEALRRRLKDGPSGASEAVPLPVATAPADDAKEALRRRLKESPSGTTGPVVEQVDPKEALRRRLRGDDLSAPVAPEVPPPPVEVVVAAPAPVAAGPAEEAPRRRRTAEPPPDEPIVTPEEEAPRRRRTTLASDTAAPPPEEPPPESDAPRRRRTLRVE
jgi:hypothetical protein